jgi:beta-glucosidase
MEQGTFYFGAATAAHQVEGNNVHSDWWKFEREVQAKDGFMSGKATNHYELFDADFALAAKLGHDAHRFSIEWAKVEPEEGKFDEKVLQHYREVFKSLKKHGLKPFVTLWHFTFPLWFAEKGGFSKKENIDYFVRYCKKIAEVFRGEFEYVITINEPEVYLYYAYLEGRWPPLHKSMFEFWKVYGNVVEAHKQVYTALKAVNSDLQIGVAKNNPAFSPGRHNSGFDKALVVLMKFLWNHMFLDKIKKHQDFIGLNYYFHRSLKLDLKLLKQFFIYPCNSCETTDMGWEVYPQGIAGILRDLWKRYRKPIIITENGVADHTDRLRGKYIADILEHIYNVKKDGVPVFGYLHWALTDNFEWADGYDPRFGLVEINYKNFARTPRPSAYVYQKLIEKYRHRK